MEIRTPALTLKGLRPGPLDDGGVLSGRYCNTALITGQAIGVVLFDTKGAKEKPWRLAFEPLYCSLVSYSSSRWFLSATMSTLVRLNSTAGLSIFRAGIRMDVSEVL